MSPSQITVRCPRCGGPVFRFGRDPRDGAQRYRCKDPGCRRQFVPGRKERKQGPKITCPRCGGNMSVFKHLSDATRFRCNGYRRKGPEKCAHKINVPLAGKKSFECVTDPKHIRLIEGKVQTAFHWNKMRFTPPTVALALYYSFFRAMPAPAVVATLRDLHQVTVSHDSVTRWFHKAAFRLGDRCAPLTVVPKKRGRKPRLLADETQLKVNGKKRWFWLTYVPRYDAYLGHNLSARRDTRAARDTLAMTYHHSPQMKKAQLLTDGLWSYGSALGDLGVDPGRHLVYKSFFESPNNNALERKWSNFKTRARPYRGFKSDLGMAAFCEAQIIYHNCFKPSVKLKGKTPAEELGIQLPDAPNDWTKLTRLLTA